MPRTARKSPGCFECSRRRIICDLASPTCLKCAKKGIACSGQTKYRFQESIANRDHLKSSQRTVQSSVPTILQWQPSQTTAAPASTVSKSTVDEVSDHEAIEEVQRTPDAALSLTSSIDLLPKGVSALFARFASAVCPHMVIFDNNNGWRDIVLPLAMSDDLIQRAVCVTAAQHVSIARPELRHRVEEQRLRAISQLTAEAMSGSTGSETMSTWIALLVLLVGETVTGGSDFRQLHKALLSFCSATADRQEAMPAQLRVFVEEQTDLFSALSHPTNTSALAFEQDCFERQFRFVHTQLTTNASEVQRLELIYVAMQVAHMLYSSSLAMDDTGAQYYYAKLVVLCRAIPSGTAGEHALVWPYFMGAAQSDIQSDRDFFISRMLAIHKRSGFANITASVDALPQVWAGKASRPWAQILPEVCPVLIM